MDEKLSIFYNADKSNINKCLTLTADKVNLSEDQVAAEILGLLEGQNFTNALINVLGTDFEFVPGWIFFGDYTSSKIPLYEPKKWDPPTPAKNIWKLFVNPNRGYFLDVLKIITQVVYSNGLFGKLGPVQKQYKGGACLEDSRCPKMVIYYQGDEQIRKFKDTITVIQKAVGSKGELFSINPKEGEFGPQECPSFAKKIGRILCYSQGGFIESGRRFIIDDTNKKDIQSALGVLFSPPNFYKFRLSPDILEIDWKKYDKDIKKIEDQDSTKGMFKKLLFSHNTSLPTFLHMLAGEYTYIKCCEDSYFGTTAIGYGAQFRYGLDSQYGDIKFVMKDEFWTNYHKGVAKRNAEPVDYVVFKDLWADKIYKSDDPKLVSILSREAREYSFREEGVTLPDICRDRFEEEARGKDYSWCNIQMHLGENVSFDDIEFIILPGYLKDISKDIKFELDSGRKIKVQKTLLNAQNNILVKDAVNPFRGKLIFGESIEFEKYYAFISERLPNEIYKKIASDESLKVLESNMRAIKEGVMRNPMFFGNSSKISTSLNAFRNEQAIYMKMLKNLNI